VLNRFATLTACNDEVAANCLRLFVKQKTIQYDQPTEWDAGSQSAENIEVVPAVHPGPANETARRWDVSRSLRCQHQPLSKRRESVDQWDESEDCQCQGDRPILKRTGILGQRCESCGDEAAKGECADRHEPGRTSGEICADHEFVALKTGIIAVAPPRPGFFFILVRAPARPSPLRAALIPQQKQRPARREARPCLERVCGPPKGPKPSSQQPRLGRPAA